MAGDGTAKVTIKNVHPNADGEYDLDVTHFNGDEAHLIKQVAGVRTNELTEAIEAGDYDLIISFALIALERSGKKIPVNVLRSADIGSIIIDAGEGDASPPDLKDPEIPQPSANTSSENNVSGGASSSITGDHQGNGHSPTGDPGSLTGSPASLPTTSDA